MNQVRAAWSLLFVIATGSTGACGANRAPLVAIRQSAPDVPVPTTSTATSVSTPHAARLAALAHATREERAGLIRAIRDADGGAGLVEALEALSADASTNANDSEPLEQVMGALQDFEDPRAADALTRYLEHVRAPHWKTEAAIRLAELGDLRAAPVLGWRLAQSPVALYGDSKLARSDQERIVAARVLADLAAIYPDAHAELRAAAEAATIAWITEAPAPAANGMRFLAAVESSAFLPLARGWADPKEPLPAIDQEPPLPSAFATAASALRYLGKTKDATAFATLAKQLRRRPPKIDTSMAALTSGRAVMLGMTLRSLEVGAANGLAELGDARAVPLLEKLIDDPMENEPARMEACSALAWVSSDTDLERFAKKAIASARDKRSRLPSFTAVCYLQALKTKTTARASADIFSAFFSAGVDESLRFDAARVLGIGVPDAIAPKLVLMLSDSALHDAAALALLLGGTPELAAKAIASYPNEPDDLKAAYVRSLDVMNDAASASELARIAANADGCGASWPRAVLSQALADQGFDDGPHSLTRVQLRHRLLIDARAAAEPQHSRALLLLRVSGEAGVLASLH